MKHICVMSEYFLPFIGGGQIYLYKVLDRLKDRYRFDIITNRIDSCLDYEEHDYAKVYRVGIRINKPKVGMSVSRLSYIVNAYRLASRIHNKDPYDLVYSHTIAGSLSGYMFARKANIPIVNTVHGIFDQGFIAKYIERAILKLPYTRIITVSEHDKRILVNMGIDEDKVSCLYVGVDLDKCNINKDDEFSIVYVGRLEEVKGIRILIKAIELLKDKGYDMRFRIVGSGRLYNLVKDKANDKVEIYGSRSHDEALELIRRSHVLVLPSFSEGLPLVILEAMASNTIVIASNVGGIGEVITDLKDGLLINPRAEELVDAIMLLYNNPELRRYIIKNACYKVARFDWSIISNDIARIFDMLIDRKVYEVS